MFAESVNRCPRQLRAQIILKLQNLRFSQPVSNGGPDRDMSEKVEQLVEDKYLPFGRLPLHGELQYFSETLVGIPSGRHDAGFAQG